MAQDQLDTTTPPPVGGPSPIPPPNRVEREAGDQTIDGNLYVVGQVQADNSYVLPNATGLIGQTVEGTQGHVLHMGGDDVIRLGWLVAPYGYGFVDMYAAGTNVARFRREGLSLPNGLGISGADNAGGEGPVFHLGGDNVIRIGWVAAPPNDGYVDMYAQGQRVARFDGTGLHIFGDIEVDGAIRGTAQQSYYAP